MKTCWYLNAPNGFVWFSPMDQIRFRDAMRHRGWHWFPMEPLPVLERAAIIEQHIHRKAEDADLVWVDSRYVIDGVRLPDNAVVFDRYDCPDLMVGGWRAEHQGRPIVKPVVYCRNQQYMKIHTLTTLPWDHPVDLYKRIAPSEPKDIDFLFYGSLDTNPEARKSMLAGISKLQSNNVVVRLQPRHSGLADLTREAEWYSRARVVLCPEGHCAICTRNYMAAMAGAVPVVVATEPVRATYNPFWHSRSISCWEALYAHETELLCTSPAREYNDFLRNSAKDIGVLADELISTLIACEKEL